MGLMQAAAETFDAMQSKYAGRMVENHATLAPVSHILTGAQIEITLDQNGKCLGCSLLDKTEPKVVIPVTEESAGRTSSPCAHPLCDQLGYIAGYNKTKHTLYIDQLKEWEESEFSHPALKPILNYAKGNTILHDLVQRGVIVLDDKGMPENEKMLVRWRVIFPDQTVECWRDLSLFDSFTGFYASKKKTEESVICMVNGREEPGASQHPKGVISINGNAKLISANDTSGFTYRGRFENDAQALTISYETSQKAHNALRWLVAEQGARAVYGGRTFLCWNPQGKEVRSVVSAFKNIPSITSIEYSDYREELKETLAGYKTKLPVEEKVVIAAFDAATTGRLALTYYNELMGSDYLERLCDWDENCCWRRGKNIQPPLLIQIVSNAFGVQREEKGKTLMKADDRVVRQQMQRLVECRINKKDIPADIVSALVNKASAPQAYEEYVWRNIVFTACAVMNKNNKKKTISGEEDETLMGWDLNYHDRSFQFGRLLAALEKVEQDYYYQTGESGEDKKGRMTTAIKSLSRFRQRPFSTYTSIQEHLWQAYIPRLNQASKVRYEKLKGEIMNIIAGFPEEELNKPLQDIYLLGYDLQRSTFFKGMKYQDTDESQS